MATSLAKQLQKLKVDQKDEIVLPQRTKLSFLFDIKQAANIDDQSLYFLCFNALNSIQKSNGDLFLKLQPFQQNILNEQSINFYRGTQTQDQLEVIDNKIKQLLGILSPYYMINQETHKIIEYLLRIYEINAYHKYDLIYGFMPYYETIWFMKITQLINLKDDKWVEWLNEFAFKGEQVSKQVLIRAMQRNQASLFDQYAKWLFGLESDENQSRVNVHHQFIGFILSNILQGMLHSNQNTGSIEYQQTLYTLLPHISKCMRSNSSNELISTGFMAIGYLGCGKGQESRLTTEYAKAFLKQVIITLKNLSDENGSDHIKLTGIKVFVGLLEFQKGINLEVGDIKQFLQIIKIGKLLNNFSLDYDLSYLMIAVCETIKISQDHQLLEIFTKFLQNSKIQLNMKTFYMMITNLVYSLTDLKDQNLILSKDHSATLNLIQFLKQLNRQYFDKIILHLLKQNFNITDFKENLSIIVSNNEQNQNIKHEQSPFIKPFSLLSALCSQRKQVQQNALLSLQDENNLKSEFVSKQELSLVIVHLSQKLSETNNDESMGLSIVKALISLTLNSEDIEYDVDYVFQKVEYAIHLRGIIEMVQDDQINKDFDSSLLQLAVALKPSSPNNLKLQAYLSFFFNQNIHSNQDSIEIVKFLSALQKKNQKKVDHIIENQEIAIEFVFDILSSQKLQPDTYIDQHNKNKKRSYFNLEQADYIISVLSENKRDENQELAYLKTINEIFLILQQTVYDINDSDIISKILTSLIKSIPQSNKIDEIVKNCIIVSLLMKQQFRNDFNMLVLHNLLFKQYFKSDILVQLKFYLNVILDCKVSESSQQYQDLQQLLFVFSIQHVKNFIESKTFMIDWASMIALILAILESSKQFQKHQLKIKQMAIQLAETVLEQSLNSKLEFKDIYDSSAITKQQSQEISQEKYTPVKPQIAQQFLQNLVDNKTSIYSDDSQISQILKNILKSEKSQGKQTFFLNLIRVLPKLQSVFAKQTLLKQLLISERQSLVFMMALSDILQQQIDLFEKGAHNELIVIRNIGKLIISQCNLEKEEKDSEKQEFVRAIVESLSLNLLKFCARNLDAHHQFEKSIINDLNIVLEEQANNIYNKQIISILKEESQFKLFKIHLQVNIHYENKNQKSNLSDKFIQQSDQVFTGEQLSILFNEQINEMRQNLFNQNKLQSLLQVSSQLKVKNSHKCIQTLLILLQKLVNISDKQNVSILISMLCLLIDETVASNRSNLESLRTMNVDDEINLISLNAIKKQFLPQLTYYIQQKGSIDQEDPFNQFMNIIGEEEKENGGKDEDLFDNIVLQMQIIRDLNRVAASTENNLYGLIKKANCSLNEIANYLQRVDLIFLDGEPRQFSQKEERIIRHLFRFYYMLVKQTLETFQIDNQENDEVIICSQRELLAQFIRTVQKVSVNKNQSSSKIFSRENTLNQYKNYLIDIVNVCGINQHGHLAFIFLFLFDDSQNDHSSNDFQLELLLSSFKQTPQENSLSLLSNLFSTLSQLTINTHNKEDDHYQLEDKFKILESTQPTDKQRLVKASAFWLSTQFQQLQDQKVIVQLKSRVISQIDKWVNTEAFKQTQNKVVLLLTEIVQKQTQDSQSTSQWIKDEFLWFNLSLGVIKDEVNFILSKKSIKTNKLSIKITRLSALVDKLLKSLNEMISLEIHTGMVLKIMKIQDSDSLSLKTNSIQILIEKIPNMFLEVSKQNQAQLSPIFSPLIQEACKFIKDQKNLQKQIIKNQDMRNYLASLFALIQQTSNENLSQDLKCSPIKLAFEIQQELSEENKKINLTLHSQILLCQSHLFEVYYQSQSIIEFLPSYSDMIIQQALNAQIYFKNEQFFSFSYAQTLLKAILSLISINYQYLGDIDKWEQLLKLLMVFDKKFGKEIEQILLTFIEKAPIAIGDENNLQVVFNTFSEILITQGCKNQDELQDIQIIAIRYFKILLFNICKSIPKLALQEHYMVIGEFFKGAMDFPGIFYKKRNRIDIPQIDDIEKEIVQSFQQFVIRLNEEQMGQIVLSFVKWSKKNKKSNIDNENELGFNLHRQIIFNKIMCGTLETLGEYAVPYIQYQLQNIIDVSTILINSIKSVDESNKKRSKLLQQYPNILDSQSIDGQGHTFVKLLRQICINLTLNFSKDINSFIQADIFEKIAEPIVSEMITLSTMKKHYKPFINDILKPLIFEMIERIDNSQLQIQLNNSILMKSRQNYKPATRLASLEIVLYLFAKLGERYLIVLNDTLPFLSESLEDDDHDVEMIAKEVIKKIETLTGESIQEYLK